MRWSPDSRLFTFFSGCLHVLNTRLEPISCWPVHPDEISGLDCGYDVTFAWTPTGLLLGAVRKPTATTPPPFLSETCWNGFQPNAGSSNEAGLLTSLLAELGAKEAVQDLAWSPSSGLALVTACKVQCDSSLYSCIDTQYKLHVMLHGALPASTIVRFARHAFTGAVVWSPSGERLLVCCPKRLQLATAACVLLVDINEGCRSPVFSPDGRHVAAVSEPTHVQQGHVSLKLFSTSDGALVFDQEWAAGRLNGSRLAFNHFGDQLLITGLYGTHVLTFGQAYAAEHMSSAQLCEATAQACDWPRDLVGDEDDDGSLSSSC